MASLTSEQLTRFATMAAAINQTRKAASQPTKRPRSPPPPDTSNDEPSTLTPEPPTATATLENSNLSDLSDPETKESRTWTRPSKKRKRPSSVVNIDDLQSVFHYDGATRRNMAPKVVYPQDQQILGRLATQPWIEEAEKLRREEEEKARMHYSSTTGKGEKGKDDEGDDLRFTQPFAPVVSSKRNTMPLKDRKRFFMYTPTPAMRRAMVAHVSEVHDFFPPPHPIGDCMLHPNPPACYADGKARQILAYNYAWKDKMGGVHEVSVNFGVIALLVNSRLSAAQKEGWIEEAWHLSHLCGNWICCNWRHHTIEDGPTNISRNACFPSPHPCKHKPPCMKDKKRKLSLPPHKSKQIPPPLPGMTLADAEEVDKVGEAETEDDGEDEEGEGDGEGEGGELRYYDTSEDGSEGESDSDSGGDGGSEEDDEVEEKDGEDDIEATDNDDAPPATKKMRSQPEIIVLSDDTDSETESESNVSKTDG